ncbi:hypothetical protein KNE206_44680 [Kitasatospora sp. NE20-6]|uniref:hypothetical protein n=1 Tax=Kitasatospora sp. NE20-6 TaxID=2859066 RepID=UPI0034DBFECB
MLLPAVPRTRLRSVDRQAVDTPFGPLTFTTTIGNTGLPLLSDELFELPGGRTLARWSRPAARVELLLTPYDPRLDPGHWGPLTACRAAVWRIDALAPLGRVQFSAGLPERLPEGADGGYDGGQALAAITVEDERTRLTVGGHDEEAICRAADTGEVPRRWAALTDQVHNHSFSAWGVDFGHNGMSWTLPPLETGDHCELPVVAAWAPSTDETANTWYAVMSSPTVLLRQVTAGPATRADAPEES